MPVAKVRAPRVKALARERLDECLARLWDHRLGLVIAPAGSGKTTLLGQFAATTDAPVAWYRPDAADVGERALLLHLHRAYTTALGPVGDAWDTVADAAGALDRVADRPVALVVDDLHVLEGTEAEAALERLLDYLPAAHVVLAASRRPPRFNLSRLRVSGLLLELGADDLRFRSWEVEHLFRHFYAEPLPPEDLAELARRTEGWAAGLQLFHLATRGKATGERRRVLNALGSQSRLVREYLARNVLDELPEELRTFLLGTCVLGRLTGRLCDDLLGITGSERVLAELERRQIFTYCIDEEGTYRYHEVLRTHLESTLVERWGHARVQDEYGRAAGLLEAAGEAADALRAYCCAEDWEAAARLLGREGEQLVDDAGSWLEGLPPAVIDSDPWLLLATARRYVAAGRLTPALVAYERAEAAFGSMAAGASTRRERQMLRLWVETRPTTSGAADWVVVLRRATQRDPLGAMRDAAVLPGTSGRFAEAVCACLAGRFVEGRRLLADVADNPDATQALVVAASLVSAWVAGITDDDDVHALDGLADEAEELGVSWLTRMVRALRSVEDAEAQRTACRRGGDAWGEAFITFRQGLRAGRDDLLQEAATLFDSLGAPVLSTWALTVRAPAPAAAEPEPAFRHPGLVDRNDDAVVLRCFGGFSLSVGGVEVDCNAVKPRARSALHLLALARGRPVHRETLVAALWPDVDARSGTRNLHVVVSSLRGLLAPGFVVRDGDAYRLALPDDADVDLRVFEAGIADATVEGLQGALDAYAGELLPEDGPADWVVEERDRYRLQAAGAARSLAELQMAAGNVAAAAAVCERGLHIDRYNDDLWRLLADAYAAADNHAAAIRARKGYEDVLAELGI